MSKQIKYFGYGANRDAKMMSFITGKPEADLVGHTATLQGFGLAVQNLDQVPDSLVVGSGLSIPPRAILAESWDKNFRSYVIFAKPGSQVVGTIWELSEDERERVKDWEMVGDWYKDDDGIALTEDGKRLDVITESLGEDQSFDHEVSGLQYETWLNPIGMFEIVATKSRREYDERQKAESEAKTKTR